MSRTDWRYAPLRWLATLWGLAGLAVVERRQQSWLTVAAAWLVGVGWTVGGIWLIDSGEMLWGWLFALIGVAHVLAAALHGRPREHSGDR